MDTQKDSAVSDVPTFKVARVGNDRKRKGAGFSFLRGGGARGVWSGAAGGSGAAGANMATVAGFTFSKFLAIALFSLVGLGAVGLGRMLGNMSDSKPAAKAKIFAQDKSPIKMEGDISNLPSNSNTIPNSMGYVSGSMDGLTPEERAKKAADAAAAAEAARIAEEEAATKAEKDRLAGSPAVDPNALLASAKADGGYGAKAGFGTKFGALSSSLGGGSSLSGGAGLSGGVGRSFGGNGGGGGGAVNKGSTGQLSATKGQSRASSARAGGARMANSNTKGFARRQLANANAYSRRASTAGKGETASSDASSAFDNNPGAGNVIAGPGIGKGSGPSSGSDTTPNPGGGGGPTDNGRNPTVDCGADRYQDANGQCQNIKTSAGKDAKPMLAVLAGIAMLALAAIGILSFMATEADYTIVGTVVAGYIKTAIATLGIVVTVLGLAMAAMGDPIAGGLCALIGGIVAVMTWGATATLTPGMGMVAGFGGAILTMGAKMLTNSKNKAPVAAQQ